MPHSTVLESEEDLDGWDEDDEELGEDDEIDLDEFDHEHDEEDDI